MSVLVPVIVLVAGSTLLPCAAWLLTRRDGAGAEALWKAALLLSLLAPLATAGVLGMRARNSVRVEAVITVGKAPPPRDPLRQERAATWWFAGLLTGVGAVNASLLWNRAARQRRRLRAGAELPADHPLFLRLRVLAARQQLPRPLRMRIAPGLPVPAVIAPGEIGLPPDFAERFSTAELDAVLAHELAHLQRRDFEWQAFAGACAALLFWQPLVGLARRELARIAELRADDCALRSTGDRTALAAALLQCARSLHGSPNLAVTPLSGESDFLRRVRRILEAPVVATPRPAARLVLPAIVLGGLLLSVAGATAWQPRMQRHVITHGNPAQGTAEATVRFSHRNGDTGTMREFVRTADGITFTEDGAPVPATAERLAWARATLDSLRVPVR